MPNGKDFSQVNWERERLVDRMRFLFCGRAYKRRFAARAAQHGVFFSSREPSQRFLFAAANVAMLSVVVWLGAQLYNTGLRNRTMAVELGTLRRRMDLQQPRPVARPIERTPEVRIVHENADKGSPQGRFELRQARADLERAQADLERAQAASLELAEQVKQAREQVESLRGEITDSKTVETRLSDHLRESELRLNTMITELTHLQAGRSADAEIIAAQKLSLRELNDRLNEAADAMASERRLLVADRDIRELMGARSLHIVDVFDVDGKGQTQRPFGRIFYTEGKSLLFYAFDLKSGSTFQAWGQQEAKAESAQSLGIFYLDDQKQNRWVLKFDDPKVLAAIDAVFVIVEPPGGSVKPNRRKMLYAYLNASPNHP